MKKVISTIFLLVALSVGLHAQSPFTFGVDGGVNLSNSSIDSDGGDKKMKIGFKLGLVAEYELQNNFFVQSGLSFTTKGFKYDIWGEFQNGSYGEIKTTWNQMYLQVPIYAGYKLEILEDTKLVFNLGPYLAYGVGGKCTVKAQGQKGKTDVFGDDRLKRFDFGLGAGAGVEFGSYFAGVKYELGLTDIGRDNDTARNRNASFTIGYRFKAK